MEAAVAERLAPPAPAAGYRIRPFVPGDERHWARIETSVGEFSEEAAARAYFERVYLPEAALRCLFVVTERDEPVATATTWAEKRRHRCVSYNSNGWPSNPPTRDGVWDVRSPRRRCDGPYDSPRRSDPAAYADMEPPGAAALPQPRAVPLLPRRRRSSCGARRGTGMKRLPQRIRRDDGGIAPHGRPRRDRRMAPHGVPVIGRIGYSSGVSM